MFKAADENSLPVRDRILNAAEQIVARDGVANLTLDAVAKETGVSKGGLLYHFPSKSALITQIVERMANRCESEQLKAIEGQPPLPGSFTRAYLKARSEGPEPQRIPIQCALLAAAGTDPEYLNPFRNRALQWQAKLESDGIDPAIATIVRLAIDALCLQAMLGMPVPQGELRQQVMQKLLAMTHPEDSDQRKESAP
ncbi:MAG TPA: TetR/AcrR family transcriptional regulator [Tepidisphaeraceae bacterium]|nr:TetR/AcrR family transcriptional regulator [Tepidisphaeraceae bacterium]